MGPTTETSANEPAAAAKTAADGAERRRTTDRVDDLMAGFDNARRSQQPQTGAYRVVSPFADRDPSADGAGADE